MIWEVRIEADSEVQERIKMNKKISIKKAVETIGLPVMSFQNNGKMLNFLVDSGSSNSLIDRNVLDEYTYETLEDILSVYGMDGIKSTCEKCRMNFTNSENKEFEETFIIQDLSAAFGYLKNEDSTVIHGILGTSFFSKYKYVIDFKNYQVYQARMKQVILMNLDSGKITVTDLPKDSMSKEEVEKFVMKYLKVDSLDNVAYIAGFIDNYKL